MSGGAGGGSAAEAWLDSHKLAAARLWATARYPYLASAVFACSALPKSGLERLTIDRWWRVHADPAVVAQATVEELGGELLHLVSHVLRDHAGRAEQVHLTEAAELHHWVDAADAEISDDFPNDTARVSPTVQPADLARPPGRLVEDYYRQGRIRSDSSADCGSGAHGRPAAWEPPPPSSDPRSSSADDQGVSDEQQRMIRRSVAAEVARAEAASVSASLRRWADDQLVNPIDWRAELAASIRRAVAATAGAVDYSYRRPSRRTGSVDGVVLPSLVRPTVQVAIVCDTSASVSDDLLAMAMAEVDGLLRAVGTRSVSVFAVDDAVRAVTRATSSRDVAMLGGGGTDMAVGIDAAMASRPRPQIVVVLTDGHTPWPDKPPRAAVVAGVLHDQSDSLSPPPRTPPSWVRAISIS